MDRVVLACLIAMALAGCRGDSHQLWPLADGRTASYVIRTDFGTRLVEAKLAAAPPILGSPSFTLDSPGGPSRLAWHRGRLLAASLGGTRFEPPLPLVISGSGTRSANWRGKVITYGAVAAGSATLEQAPSNITVAGRSFRSVKATLRFQSLESDMELVTHYVSGIGPVWQEQRSRGLFDIGFEYLRS